MADLKKGRRAVSIISTPPSHPSLKDVILPIIDTDLTGTECPNCKANVPATDRYCSDCGTEVKKVVPETPEQLRARILQLTGDKLKLEKQLADAAESTKTHSKKLGGLTTTADGDRDKLHERLTELEGDIRKLGQDIVTANQKATEAQGKVEAHEKEKETWTQEKAEVARRYTVEDVNAILKTVCAEFKEAWEDKTTEYFNKLLGRPPAQTDESNGDVLQLGEAGQPAEEPKKEDSDKAIKELTI